MRRWDIEFTTGIFIILGLLAMAFLSVRMARMEVVGGGGYLLETRFSTVEGLKVGARIEVAGVEVGKVQAIDIEDYQAVVTLSIREDVKIPDDTIVSIRTKGLLGDKYVRLNPGGSDIYLEPGEEIFDTEAPINLEELIANFIFGKI
jgi:phospholipid/cholesterol/gamma-HCH transport system substrate-binding protein